MIRIELEGAAQVCGGLVEPSRFGERASEIALRRCGIGRQLHGTLKMDERFGEATVGKEQRPEFLVRRGEIRIERKRPLEALRRIGGPARGGQRLADVELQVSIPRRQRRAVRRCRSASSVWPAARSAPPRKLCACADAAVETDGRLQLSDGLGRPSDFEVAAAEPRALVRIVRAIAHPNLGSENVVPGLPFGELLPQNGRIRGRTWQHLQAEVPHLVARLRPPDHAPQRTGGLASFSSELS